MVAKKEDKLIQFESEKDEVDLDLIPCDKCGKYISFE